MSTHANFQVSTPAPPARQARSALSHRSFTHRFLFPVLAAAAVWALLYLLNAIPVSTENQAFYRMFKNSVLAAFYIDIFFAGGLIVYPILFFRGASLGERIVGVFSVPVAYILSEMVRVSEFFSVGESIYYGFSTMGLLILVLNLGLAGTSEMVCRLVYRRRTHEPVRVLSFGPLASLVVMAVMVYLLFIWGMGVHWFYIYQEGYKLLFVR